MEGIVCTVDSVRYHDEVSGFTIMTCIENKSGKTITMKCNSMAYPSEGITIVANGEWINDRNYGEQFVINTYRTELPTSSGAIEQYLSSGLFKGIGVKLAKKIVDKFGKETITIISNKDKALLTVHGVSPKKAQVIWDEWDKHEDLRNLMDYLQPYNFTSKLIIKIYKAYGEQSISKITENPYNLILDIDGIGFKKADDIALKMGFDREGFPRCAFGMRHCLQEAADEGNCYCDKSDIILETSRLLNVSIDIINNYIERMIRESFICDVESKIYLPYILDAEKNVANVLRNKIFASVPIDEISSFIYDKEIDKIQETLGIEYNDMQRRAIKSAIVNQITVLTGGPGTGKTTVTKGIIEALRNHSYTILGGAPTGKAAKRMSEVTGLNAMTIHRLLQYNPQMGYQKNKDNPFWEDVLIIDEMSMVNITLMSHLCDAISERTRIILIGDMDQLPCIGPGNILRDVIETNGVPVVKLTEIFRQAQDSDIIKNAHKINHGEMPICSNSKTSDFFFIPKYNERDISDTVYELITERLPKAYGIKSQDIQLLTPMRINGLGAIQFNKGLQARINPSKTELKYGDTIYRLGDNVMQIKNNYEKGVFNGDTGIITDIDNEERIITVKIDDESYEYDAAEFDELMLSYACTIHKSQGSEYPIVVIPIHKSQYIMLQRNLIYTAITRTKKICVIVGEPESFAHAIRNNKIVKRRTNLKTFIEN